MLHDRQSIDAIAPMNDKDYQVRGCTALLDAIGGAIHHIGNVHKYAREEDRPNKTLFVIITDGMENSSTRYSRDKVKHMIERQREKYGWEFMFLGANIDAIAEAGRYGIREEMAANYICDERGTALNYSAVGVALGSMRANRPLTKEWKSEIDQDYMERKRK